ncbi:MAG: hypothetical protein PHC83_05465 [Bacteroidales bacterium]|nr:hypothetical protein [Bacteroidales bacterium]MDD4209241.1 hypothetical protein [Bacteroidales bacterium]
MKKIFTLCFLCTLVFSLSSQTIKTLYPTVEKSLMFYSYKLHPLKKGSVVDDENKYVFRDCFSENILYTITPSGKVSASPAMKLSKDYKLRGCFQTEEEIAAIYSNYSKGVNKFYININNKKKLTWHPEEVMTIVSENKDESYAKVVISSNNSYFCITILAFDKKDKFKYILVTVFNASGQQIWENTLSPEFSNKTFSLDDIEITNEGTVYLCVTAYSGAKKKTFDEKVYIYEVKETDYQQFESTQDIGYIATAGLKILKNGNVFVGGYYSEKMDETYKGSFSLIYNPKEQSISSFSHLDFPSTFSDKDVESLSFDQIIELSNGRIVTLGEQLMTVIYYNQNGGRTYNYYAKNIVCTGFSANGEVENYKIIKKNQFFGTFTYFTDFRRMCMSFYTFEKDGTLCLLFNDHIGNYNSTKKTITMINPLRNKAKLMVNLVKIDGDELSSHIVFNGKTTKKNLQALLFAEDNTLIFSSVGKAVAFDQITIN